MFDASIPPDEAAAAATSAPAAADTAAPAIPERFKYWAAAAPEDIGKHLVTKAKGVASDSLAKRIRDLQHRAYCYYNGLDPSGVHATSQVLRDGEQGELAAVRVNHARSLVNTLKNIITESKVVWTPKAINADAQTQKRCRLAAALLEYYFSEEQVLKFAMGALELALVFAEGFVLPEWDPEAGEVYGVGPDGAELKTGDLCFRKVSPWDVLRDPTKNSWEDVEWVIVRLRQNRYSLIKRYAAGGADEEAAEKILSAGELESEGGPSNPKGEDFQTDDVSTYLLLHRASPALPEGRRTLFLANQTVLEDGPLDYGYELPIYRVAADELIDTPYGYTSFVDILGVQEVLDSLHTSVSTNQTTFGTQLIAMPQGSEISPEDISGGMKVVYYPPDAKPPAPLQLTQTAPEVFRYIEALKEDQRLLIGINGVVQGEAPSGEMSGSALALLNEKAKAQSSNVQGNYLRLLERLGECALRLLDTRCPAERKLAITGESNRYLLQETEIAPGSFSAIKSVSVELGNPQSQTPMGRWEMAKELAQMVPGLNPMQLLQVINTGSVEPLTSSLQRELILIKAENEALSRGEPQPTLDLDDHQLHAREHRAEMADPEVRKNPAAVQALLMHIKGHLDLWLHSDPLTMLLIGQQPPPQVPGVNAPLGAPPAGPPPGALAPHAGPGPKGPPPPAPKAAAGNPAAGGPPPTAQLPMYPKVAGSDERVKPTPPPVT